MGQVMHARSKGTQASFRCSGKCRSCEISLILIEARKLLQEIQRDHLCNERVC